MTEKAIAQQIIKEMEEYRVGQRVRVRELQDKLQETFIELHEKKLSASMRACRRLDALLRKKTQLIEKALRQFTERSNEEPLEAIGAITLVKLVELVETLDDNINRQKEIPRIVEKEGKYQMRFPRAYDMLLGHRALLEHMLSVVERDTVANATMDLVTRLHEINMTVPQLPRGNRRKELADYKIALKNIGVFVRFVKKTHMVFCRVYPKQGM